MTAPVSPAALAGRQLLPRRPLSTASRSQHLRRAVHPLRAIPQIPRARRAEHSKRAWGHEKDHAQGYATGAAPVPGPRKNHAITATTTAELIDDLLAHFPDGPPEPKNLLSFVPSAEKPPVPRGTKLPPIVLELIEALKKQDTRALVVALRRTTGMSEQMLADAVSAMPRGTITEIFIALRPEVCAKQLDPLDEIAVSSGMSLALDMVHLVDFFGIRWLYRRLFHYTLRIANAVRASGQRLVDEEIITLLGLAAAKLDRVAVHRIWRLMDADNPDQHIRLYRGSALYAAFIEARFRTLPIHYGFDKARRVSTPLTHGAIHHRIGVRTLRAMVGLRLRTISPFMLHPPGLKRYEAHEVVRKRNAALISRRRLMWASKRSSNNGVRLPRQTHGVAGPAMRVWRVVNFGMNNGVEVTERLLCAAMVAFGRAGYLRFVGTHILEKFFGVRPSMSLPKTGDYKPHYADTWNASGRLLVPSTRLMEAVVETYCSTANFPLALEVVEKISRKFRMRIPDTVWRSLLEWAYTIGTQPVSTLWKMAGRPERTVNKQMVDGVFSMMTSAEMGVTPTFPDYLILAKHKIRCKRRPEAIEALRVMMAMYRRQCREYEATVFAWAGNLRDGVNLLRAEHQKERARVLKEYMWYSLQYCFYALLRKHRGRWTPKSDFADGAGSYQLIPDLVWEFNEVMPNPIAYQTPTGYIELVDPSADKPQRRHTRDRIITVPAPKTKRGGGMRWGHVRLKRSRSRFHSSHSLRTHYADTSEKSIIWMLTGSYPQYYEGKRAARRVVANIAKFGSKGAAKTVDSLPESLAEEVRKLLDRRSRRHRQPTKGSNSENRLHPRSRRGHQRLPRKRNARRDIHLRGSGPRRSA